MGHSGRYNFPSLQLSDRNKDVVLGSFEPVLSSLARFDQERLNPLAADASLQSPSQTESSNGLLGRYPLEKLPDMIMGQYPALDSHLAGQTWQLTGAGPVPAVTGDDLCFRVGPRKDAAVPDNWGLFGESSAHGDLPVYAFGPGPQTLDAQQQFSLASSGFQNASREGFSQTFDLWDKGSHLWHRDNVMQAHSSLQHNSRKQSPGIGNMVGFDVSRRLFHEPSPSHLQSRQRLSQQQQSFGMSYPGNTVEGSAAGGFTSSSRMAAPIGSMHSTVLQQDHERRFLDGMHHPSSGPVNMYNHPQQRRVDGRGTSGFWGSPNRPMKPPGSFSSGHRTPKKARERSQGKHFSSPRGVHDFSASAQQQAIKKAAEDSTEEMLEPETVYVYGWQDFAHLPNAKLRPHVSSPILSTAREGFRSDFELPTQDDLDDCMILDKALKEDQ